MEKPICQVGYPPEQLKRMLGEDKYTELTDWLFGQTLGVCDSKKFDYATGKWIHVGCGPHGSVVYEWDLQTFLQGRPIID